MRLIDYNSSAPSPPDRLQNIEWQSSAAPDPYPIISIGATVPYEVTVGSPLPADVSIVFVQGGGHQLATGTWDISGSGGATTFTVPGNPEGAGLFRPGPACNVYLCGKASAYLPAFVGDTNSSPPSSPPAVEPLGGAVPAPNVGDGAAGKVLRADGTWGYPSETTGGGGSPPTGVPNFADGETPSGLKNGTNQTYTLAHSPNPAESLVLVWNGVVQLEGTDYTLSGSTIVFASAKPNSSLNEWILCWYRY